MLKVDPATFIKAPIDEIDPLAGLWEPVPRHDIPEKCQVELRVWPADTETKGGILLPLAEGRAHMGACWVKRSLWDNAEHFPVGASVIMPDHIIGGGLVLSRYKDGNPMDVMVPGKDIYFIHPVIEKHKEDTPA